MKITFLGAARTVTGSCYLLEHNNSRFLVDCGLFQGSKVLKERNYQDFPFNVTDIDFVLLTHAHIDHSGLLPKLYRCGYQNPIYATSATVALAAVMLPDSGHIQEMEIERKNRKRTRAGKPLLESIYTAQDAIDMQPLFREQNYGQAFEPAEGIKVVFRDAGHILGSAMIELYYTEQGQTKKILFTGDLGRYDQAITEDPETITEADFMLIESTYGNRIHGVDAEDEMPHFAQVINSTFAKGGNVVIPAFAVDRTQDILMMIHAMTDEGKIGPCTVYVDSPLAVKATEIFAEHPEYYDKFTSELYHKEGKPPFILDNLVFARTMDESLHINAIKSNAIIISASGMADAGRIKHHLKHNLWRPECSVLFFGYQAEGTLGRRLLDGEKRVTIHGEEIDVKADIVNMEGFSAHADKEEMLSWLDRFQSMPQQIFVVHGEEESALSFAETLHEKYGVETTVPQMGDMVELSAEKVVITGNKDFAQQVMYENILVDINTVVQKLAMTQDIENLIRARDFLKRLC
ncbi:MAG: MBL fold metallo-hydrolase [Firmicutes bacterium]|nr:MBL fold metallo-hydrolase [Bacillota bacterium]